ncbi:ubiquinone/menaquinone biosynthesis C-methylase UbiE [Micromonospora pisi]|uniref:Ubiquinone/menaquinone biosynthesis C-methylase UbiE n=1 Tax=Micromonospora pisi TaxID=589240 RepID=A0A495JGL4_9ACTN|nr:methyltransferase domain-containing protein [Micromonospora pisi]RKR87935.1 ubiquinone/menaquinone biosynthesis C-methylase UbiE [Micromonospora pisi]
MGMTEYAAEQAEAFAANRQLDPDAAAHWREAVARHLRPRAGTRVLDLGAGTGTWARLFTDWYGIEMVAVEPSAEMRARSVFPGMLAGDAAALPLPDAYVDGAWISTVIHHVTDLGAAAAELRRVLRPGAPVLIRSAFAGRHEQITLFRYFPEAIRVLDGYPSVEQVRDTFTTAGFEFVALEQVPQVSAASLAQAVANLRRAAHTPLQLISDAAYAAGLDRMRTAARVAGPDATPVVDRLDLLVLRRDGMRDGMRDERSDEVRDGK